MNAPRTSLVGTGTQVAVSPHRAASEAGLDVMRRGGNAVDAAIAVNAVLGVVLPTTCGIGGDLLALVLEPGADVPRALNASGRGGSGLDAGSLRSEGHTEFPLYHPASVSVPGCVDGWIALAESHGSLPLATLIDPAVRLANEGFEVSAELAKGLAFLHPHIAAQPSAVELYPDHAPPTLGQTIRRPLLAESLERIATDGRAGFYSGVTGSAVANSTCGILDLGDLSQNQADWVEPLHLDVFGSRGWTMPPSSQGYLTLAAAWIAEFVGGSDDPDDVAFWHRLIESYRAVAWERNDVVADPDHLDGYDHLLDPDRLERIASSIDLDRAGIWPASTPQRGGTAYMCTVDANGLGVSLIQSNFHGIGSRISAGSTGIWLHNRAAGFNLTAGHPNEAGPGKRPLHTLSPTLWTSNGLDLILGTRGGHQQPQYLLQVAALLKLAGLDPGAAQQQPRWSIDEFGPGSASRVAVESRMPEEIVAGLRDRGHTVTTGPAFAAGWGPISLIDVTSSGATGAADPRISTAHSAAE